MNKTYQYDAGGGTGTFILRFLMIVPAAIAIFGFGWADYFRRGPTPSMSLRALISGTLFASIVLFVLFRENYIQYCLRPRFERIIFEEKELVHINHRGKEDARLPYEDIKLVKALSFMALEVDAKGRWKIIAGDQSITLSSNLADLDCFWQDLTQHCDVQLPSNVQSDVG
ncbi:MAG TPA: hypothetical protein VGL56_19490 [Fimbriimonadaceae bacterium]|jgi:hypothetical protein